MRFAYPNVSQEKFIGCGRYVALLPKEVPEEEGYELATSKTRNLIQDVYSVVSLIAPESFVTKQKIYEIKDQDRIYQGSSQNLAFFLTLISRSRTIKLERIHGDIWCTGSITLREGHPCLDPVYHQEFKVKLQAFLSDDNADNLFIIPSPNAEFIDEDAFEAQNIAVVPLKGCWNLSSKMVTHRKTIITVLSNELNLLVKVLFTPLPRTYGNRIITQFEQDRAITSENRNISSRDKGIFSTILEVGLYIILTILYFIVQRKIPIHPLAIYGGMSLLTIWAYKQDKRISQLGGWRTCERTLHLLETCGGWPGALLAQWCYRYKLRKFSYQMVFWLIVAGHGFLWYHQQVSIPKMVTGVIDRQTPTQTQKCPIKRSIENPPDGALIVNGIVKEIRPAEGVIVALQKANGTEGIIDKSTLVKDFSTMFTPGEHIQVAIKRITIEGEKKLIELELIDEK